MDRPFVFKGYFRPGYPFGDTLRYLESSEDSSIEDAIIRSFTVFYYPKILQRLDVSTLLIEKVKAQSVSYCRDAIADLDKLENTINQHHAERVSKLKRRSLGSQYFFEVGIDTSEFEPSEFKQEFVESLEYFESGKFGDIRSQLGQAVCGLYHPLAANAFADPINQVIDAIHSSRTKFRGLLVDFGSGRSTNDTPVIPPVFEKVTSNEVPQKSKITNW